MPRTNVHVSLAAVMMLTLATCKRDPTCGDASTACMTSTAAGGLTRDDFNRASLSLALPLFWSADKNGDGTLNPDELAVVFGLGEQARDAWVKGDAFTPAFVAVYARIAAAAHPAARREAPRSETAEDQRHAAINKEISQGYFTLVQNDFRAASAEDKALVAHVVRAATLIERLYARQQGAFGLDAKISPDDGESRLAFFLNQGPWCSGPSTENDPACSALSSHPPHVSGLYPADLQATHGFCAALAKEPNAKELLDPFALVARDAAGKLVAVPYTLAYKDDMNAVATELDTAAQAIASATEAPLRAYLLAAAQAFRDNRWQPADEAWAKMNATNSKWYLRVAPDEVYFEPCSEKAGFHLSFALINKASLAWQSKLDPLKGKMELELAKLAGAPYRARTVAFHLPDFIDIILNAGDSREARGATIGQSLPNWDKVADEGRGRTVAMANLYTDDDSKQILRAQAATMLCAESLRSYVDDAEANVMGTVLHEAAHNLGPAHDYRVGGKNDSAVFGGPLASTLEELKAQTSALYLTDWLVTQGSIPKELAAKAHTKDIAWALGHISRGMWEPDGKPKPYSQLAAIQVGFLRDEGAITWRADELAANGDDKGCLEINLTKLPAAIAKLEGQVLGIKARGTLASAKDLQARYVDAKGDWQAIVTAIAARYLRYPRASFLYAIEL